MKKTEAKKRGIKTIQVHMGAFDFIVNVVIGDYKAACAFALWKFEDKTTNLEDFDMGYIPRGKCFFRRGYAPIIWIPSIPKKAREYATLSHECLHAVFHLFEWAGLPLTRDNEEVMTHSMAHLINSVLSKKKG